MTRSKKKMTGKTMTEANSVCTKANSYKKKVSLKISAKAPVKSSAKPAPIKPTSRSKSKFFDKILSAKVPIQKLSQSSKLKLKANANQSFGQSQQDGKTAMEGQPDASHLKGTRKMIENRFSQQRIPACTPLLTVGSAIPYFALFTISFIIIGGLLWLTNDYAVENEYDYTHCTDYITQEPCHLRLNRSLTPHNSSTNTTSSFNSRDSHTPCICQVHVFFKHSIPWNVFLYYSIDSMFQSYLPYSESIDERQMYGHLNGSKEACGSFTALNGTPIAPCGMVANSIFNDTIELFRMLKHPRTNLTYLLQVPLYQTGVTWTPKYAAKNPPVPHFCPAEVSPLKCAFNGTVTPPNWHRHIWELDPSDPDNNGYENEQLQSWLRFAPFGKFRKLYGRVDHVQKKPVPNKKAAKYFFGKNLPNGSYLLNITYNYPVAGFEGRKTVIISNTTWMGGKSPFLAYLYIITAAICLVLLVIFFAIDRKFGKLSKEVYSFLHNKSNLRQHQRATRLMERANRNNAFKGN